MENEKLAERLRNNDETALEEIIDRFTPLVSTIIYNLANGSMSQPDIEEITSDTFFSLWCNRDKVEKDKLKGYLCCIAKNKAKYQKEQVNDNRIQKRTFKRHVRNIYI